MLNENELVIRCSQGFCAPRLLMPAPRRWAGESKKKFDLSRNDPIHSWNKGIESGREVIFDALCGKVRPQRWNNGCSRREWLAIPEYNACGVQRKPRSWHKVMLHTLLQYPHVSISGARQPGAERHASRLRSRRPLKFTLDTF